NAQSGQGQVGAQPRAQAQPMQHSQATALNFVQRQQANELSAEWLINKNVYSSQDEDIGTIEDLIIGQDGRVQAVVIGVGGFLGLGEKSVAVNFGALEMRPTPDADVADTAQPRTQAEQSAEGQPAQPRDQAQTGMQAQQRDQAQTGMQSKPDSQTEIATQDRQRTADRGEETVIDGNADGLRIYVNASREQLENAPEYVELDRQNGFFGGGIAR
ncbi:MAG TPA: PRC-barrel domain-containing protein, partial [Xanthobacteraceae bacterium]|nr:PRC-barrel domain-containing protein [Xanthobacteraceae bacterium]